MRCVREPPTWKWAALNVVPTRNNTDMNCSCQWSFSTSVCNYRGIVSYIKWRNLTIEKLLPLSDQWPPDKLAELDCYYEEFLFYFIFFWVRKPQHRRGFHKVLAAVSPHRAKRITNGNPLFGFLPVIIGNFLSLSG